MERTSRTLRTLVALTGLFGAAAHSTSAAPPLEAAYFSGVTLQKQRGFGSQGYLRESGNPDLYRVDLRTGKPTLIASGAGLNVLQKDVNPLGALEIEGRGRLAGTVLVMKRTDDEETVEEIDASTGRTERLFTDVHVTLTSKLSIPSGCALWEAATLVTQPSPE